MRRVYVVEFKHGNEWLSGVSYNFKSEAIVEMERMNGLYPGVERQVTTYFPMRTQGEGS